MSHNLQWQNPGPRMYLDYEGTMAKANEAHAAGNLPEAERLAKEALAMAPNSVKAQLLVGVLATKQGRLPEGKAFLERVCASEPNSFVALYWLSRIAGRNGEHEKALRLAERASWIHPDDPTGLQNLGQCQIAARRFEEASVSLRRLTKLTPSSANAHHQLGIALQSLGRESEALAEFREAVSLDSALLTYRISLGQLLLSRDELTEAIQQAEEALKIDPNSISAHHLFVDALFEDRQTERAEEHLKKLVEKFPNDSKTHAIWGLRLVVLGRMQEAREAFNRSIEIQPKQGFAYVNLAQNMRIREEDRDLVQRMEALVQDPEINAAGRRHLHYGLGKAYEDLGEYGKAMKEYDAANEIDHDLKFGNYALDRAKYREDVDWTIRTFSKALLDSNVEVGSADPLPIFIVGMIRSGTTLVEQILSCHPGVEAGGERKFWPGHWREAFVDGHLDQGKSKSLTEEYLALMHRLAGGKPHVTDKMPANFGFLGLIHLLLPHAKIIHIRRNPVDNCLSIYATPNSTKNPTGNNRSNIVFGYRQYERLMGHWRKVLPEGAMHDVRYEELISDRERVTRELVAFCGMQWDDRCLRPESNERKVRTPSVWQVRQPVYSRSIGRAQNFAPWLREFEELR